jgi:hypothetical protein
VGGENQYPGARETTHRGYRRRVRTVQLGDDHLQDVFGAMSANKIGQPVDPAPIFLFNNYHHSHPHLPSPGQGI